MFYLHMILANAADDVVVFSNPLTLTCQDKDDKATKIDAIIEESVVKNTQL